MTFVRILALIAITHVPSHYNRWTDILMVGGHVDGRPTVECIFSLP